MSCLTKSVRSAQVIIVSTVLKYVWYIQKVMYTTCPRARVNSQSYSAWKSRISIRRTD